MATSHRRFWTTAIAAIMVCLNFAAGARAQDSEAVRHSNEQQRQLEQLTWELRDLQTQFHAIQASAGVRPLPPLETGNYDLVRDNRDSNVRQDRSLESRVAGLETSAKKSAESDARKKAADAEKPLVKVGGKIQTDLGFFSQDANNIATVGDIQDGADFRRACIAAYGTIAEVTNYRVEMDFAMAGRPTFREVFLGVTELPYIGNIRVGHYKEWFGLDQLNSDDYMTFIERGLPDAFAPARNWGISAYDYFDGEWGTWAIGAFKPDSDTFGDDVGDSGEWAVTNRLTALPWYDEPSEGRYFLHLGGAYSYRDPDSLNPLLGNGSVRFSSRPEAFMSETGAGSVPFFVDTGNILAGDNQLYSAEAAFVYGAFSLQSEWMASTVDSLAAGDLYFDSVYVYATYFLTGESRGYNRKIGWFDHQKVFEPFFCVCTPDGICKGSGAWELAVRWSYIDLNDGPVRGGYLDDLTFGVNWYLNPNMRVMFNYVHADLNNPVRGESEADIYLTRFQVNW